MFILKLLPSFGMNLKEPDYFHSYFAKEIYTWATKYTYMFNSKYMCTCVYNIYNKINKIIKS